MPMIPPTTTHQEKQVRVVNGKPVFYEPQELKTARMKLTANLAKHVPKKKLNGAVRMIVKWIFPKGGHPDGTYKDTKPDTDNLQKLLKDVMTDLHFWKMMHRLHQRSVKNSGENIQEYTYMWRK